MLKGRIKSFFEPSFPKAICLTVLLCSVVMLKYRTVPAPKHAKKGTNHLKSSKALGLLQSSKTGVSHPIQDSASRESIEWKRRLRSDLASLATLVPLKPAPETQKTEPAQPRASKSAPFTRTWQPDVLKKKVASHVRPKTASKIAARKVSPPLYIEKRAIAKKSVEVAEASSDGEGSEGASEGNSGSSEPPVETTPDPATYQTETNPNSNPEPKLCLGSAELDNQSQAPIRSEMIRPLTATALDNELEIDPVILGLASQDPLDEVVDSSLSEASLSEDYQSDRLVSPLQSDLQFSLDKELPRETRLYEVVGSVQQNDFSEIRSQFGLLVGETLSRLVAPVSRIPKLELEDTEDKVGSALQKGKTGSRAVEPKVVAQLADNGPTLDGDFADHSGPELVLPIAPVVSSVVGEALSAGKNAAPSIRGARLSSSAETEAANDLNPVTTQGEANQLVSAPVTSHTEARSVLTPQNIQTQSNQIKPASEPFLVKPLVPSLKSASTVSRPLTMVLQRDGAETQRTPSGLPAPRRAFPGETKAKVAEDREAKTSVSEDLPVGGPIYGKISVDDAFDRWLQAKRGHIELFLHPLGSPDPQDTVFVDYQFPSDEFSFDASKLTGNYQLVAGVYVPESPTAVAQISYPKVIHSFSHKERMLFVLTKDRFDLARMHVAAPSRKVVLTLTLFEGASGDFRHPKPVQGGRVSVVGFSNWGYFSSDSEGNIRIPNVPGRSELLIEVWADGFYPTRKIIPTFLTNAYAPVYLISRDKVEAITKYFTSGGQSELDGIVMGRVFDSNTRTPKSGEQLHLTYREDRPLYFDRSGLPNMMLDATTDNGLFAFFNVVPAIQSLIRDLTGPASLINILPPPPAALKSDATASVEYIELGRGGKRSLWGKLVDPYSGSLSGAKIRLVGDSRIEVTSDASGLFRIPGLDYPPGVVTIEVAAKGYPTTWHTLPWNNREKETTPTLFMLKEDRVAKSADSVARIKLHRAAGSIIGGAEASFFKKGVDCVFVSLQDAKGMPVGSTRGPFPLNEGDTDSTKPLCLSKNNAGFGFYNLRNGEYLLKWQSPTGEILRSHFVHVGIGRLSVVVN